jgi:hypothetical protein
MLETSDEANRLLKQLTSCQEIAAANLDTDTPYAILPMTLILDTLGAAGVHLISRADSNLDRVLGAREIKLSRDVGSVPGEDELVVLDLTSAGAVSFDSSSALSAVSGRWVLLVGHLSTAPQQELWRDLLSGHALHQVLDSPCLHLALREKDDAAVLTNLIDSNSVWFEIFKALSLSLALASSREIGDRAETLEMAVLKESLSNTQERSALLTQELLGLRDAVIGAEATTGVLEWRISRLNAHIDFLQRELKTAHKQNKAILESRTFKLGRFFTLPLRVIRKIMRKLTS